jgi:hypothetical protein
MSLDGSIEGRKDLFGASHHVVGHDLIYPSTCPCTPLMLIHTSYISPSGCHRRAMASRDSTYC